MKNQKWTDFSVEMIFDTADCAEKIRGTGEHLSYFISSLARDFDACDLEDVQASFANFEEQFADVIEYARHATFLMQRIEKNLDRVKKEREEEDFEFAKQEVLMERKRMK